MGVAYEPVDDYTDQVDAVSSDTPIDLTAMHGFALTAAKGVNAASNKKIVLIPSAKGSTSATQWAPSADTLDRATLFGSANYRARQAVRSNLSAMWWFGHETSATSGQLEWYRRRWAGLLTQIRRDLSTAPIIFAQLAKNTDGPTNTSQVIASSEMLQLEAGFPATALVVGAPVVDTDFKEVDWTAGVPNGWAVVNNDASNYIVENGLGVQFVSNNTKALAIEKTNALTIAQQYLVEVECSALSAGGVKFFANGDTGVVCTAGSGGVGLYRFIITATGTSFVIFRNATTNCSIRSCKIWPYTSGAVWQPRSNEHMVVSFDLPLIDNIHLNQDGQREIGRRFALATRQHVLGESVNGTGPRLVSISQPTASTVKIKYNKTVSEPQTSLYNGQHIVYDSGVAATISTVSRDPADDTAVLITLSAPIAGTMTVSYGDVVASGAGVWLRDVVQDSDFLPAPCFYRLGVF